MQHLTLKYLNYELCKICIILLQSAFLNITTVHVGEAVGVAREVAREELPTDQVLIDQVLTDQVLTEEVLTEEVLIGEVHPGLILTGQHITSGVQESGSILLMGEFYWHELMVVKISMNANANYYHLKVLSTK